MDAPTAPNPSFDASLDASFDPATSPRFRRLLVGVVVVPVALMAVVAALLAWQITHLVADARMVARSDHVLAQAYDVQKLTVDLETGLRGFLVTGDAAFLEPYDRAKGAIGDQSAELRGRVGPTQAGRVSAIDGLRVDWLAYAADQIARRRAGGDYATVVREGRGKQTMDRMRGVFAELIGAETAVRDARAADATTATRTTFGLVAAVAVLGGGVLAVTGRRQVSAVGGTYHRAIAVAAMANASLEHRVAERTAELAEANKELEAFAYSISHDLRAPMRHIAGFADLLRRSVGPTLSADDAENLTTIRDTAKHAGRMVDDLLGFSRVGRTLLNLLPVDVSAMAERCRHELAPDIGKRDVRWTVCPIPPVRADPALLKMAVVNLLGNAVKYTGQRDVAEVTVGPADWPAAAGAPPAGETVTWAVADNGVGFDMAYAGKLWGVFQRLHRAEEFAGTGIGLANVRRIIGRLGGAVYAHGVPDGGATFYVCLPAAVPDPSQGGEQ